MVYFLKGALVGSYKGSCRLYNTSGMFLGLSLLCLFVWLYDLHLPTFILAKLSIVAENKLQPKCVINLQNKKKKSHLKKITGFQVRSLKSNLFLYSYEILALL